MSMEPVVENDGMLAPGSPLRPGSLISILTACYLLARRQGVVRSSRSMQVRLLRKLADVVDGIDLSGRVVGEIIDLSEDEADLLVAEGWAEPAEEQVVDLTPGARLPLATAADAPRRRRRHRR